jgi:molecular chaperone DnaK
VRALLAEYFSHLEPKDIRSDINPDEAVSRGAALVARKHNPSVGYSGPEIDLVATGAISQADKDEASTLVLQDVTSHTLGILVNAQDFHRIIPKESRIPAEMTEGGFVNAGPSSSVDVLIFQGEKDIAYDNSLIGKLPIPLPEPKERGHWRFEVTFKLNNDGILSVFVKRLNDNVTFDVKVQCSLRSGAAKVAESTAHVANLMAGGDDAGVNIPAPPPPVPAKAAAAAASSPQAAPVETPPANTPDEFRSLARRCCKLLEQPMDASKRERLLKSYNAFVAAVKNGSSNVEDLGDELGDVYLTCKP